MNTEAKLVVLADNTAAGRHVLGEHGLAFWIETGAHRVLFDTGQGRVLADNALALRVDAKTVDTVVLSHGHYDHTGGLAGVLRGAAGPVTVHAHPEALLPKFKQDKKGCRDIGMPEECRKAIRGSRCRFMPSEKSEHIVPGIRTTGEIPRRHPEEASVEAFCRDPAGRLPDSFPDDQALFMETARGTVVLLGCAHSGVINTLDHVCQLTAGRPVHAVIGGMHLGPAPRERMEWTLRELRRFNMDLLVPMHCTGQEAAATLWAAFPHACRASGAGTVFEF